MLQIYIYICIQLPSYIQIYTYTNLYMRILYIYRVQSLHWLPLLIIPSPRPSSLQHHISSPPLTPRLSPPRMYYRLSAAVGRASHLGGRAGGGSLHTTREHYTYARAALHTITPHIYMYIWMYVCI